MSTPQCTTNRTAYFPFDIGKNVHWFAAYRGPQLLPLLPPQPVRANQAGFEQAATTLSGLLTNSEFDEIVAGHEPTGLYHSAWAYAFSTRFADALRPDARPHLTYRCLNPYHTKQARQRQLGRNRKTDALDLPAIARCLAEGAGTPVVLLTAGELAFNLWAASWRVVNLQLRALTRRLYAAFDHLWPGALADVARFRQTHPTLEPPTPLVLSRPFERQLIQTLLQHCPDPHRLRALSAADLTALLRKGMGRAGAKTAQKVLTCVQAALLPPPDLTPLLAQRLQAEFAAYQTVSARLATLQTQAAQLVPGSPAAVLTTIPGVSACLAARYLAGVGQAQRFTSAAQVWALAGFDPLSSDSGDTRHAGVISKKGDPAFRDTLCLLGFQTSQHCPPIARARQAARRRGLSQAGAILHAAHKANRLCWYLLYHQEGYAPARHR